MKPEVKTETATQQKAWIVQLTACGFPIVIEVAVRLVENGRVFATDAKGELYAVAEKEIIRDWHAAQLYAIQIATVRASDWQMHVASLLAGLIAGAAANTKTAITEQLLTPSKN